MTFHLAHRCAHGSDDDWHDCMRESPQVGNGQRRHTSLAGRSLDPRQCREFIRKVAHYLGVKVPDVKFESGGTCYVDRGGTMTHFQTRAAHSKQILQ